MSVKVWNNFSQIATLEGVHLKDGRKLLPEDLSLIENASIAFNDTEILWLGDSNDLPKEYKSYPSKDFSGKTLTPGLVDCHTHLIFGGDRAKEYSMRLNGADYQDIANAGGGILNTMKGTNSLSSNELLKLAIERVERIQSYGVKTIEVKSGYGLNLKKERELTQIIHKLKEHFKGKVQIINTYMAAHAIPKEFNSSQEFIDQVVFPLLEELASEKIIDAVDIFHEEGYFSYDDTERLFDKAKTLNIPFKSHADEFQDNKGALLAAKKGALSCDHLLCTLDDGIQALSESNTVATLLPGTGFFLGKPQANARRFLDAGCKVAIGSDYNPGSCHCDNVLLLASLAAPHYKMNICELWAAITYNASHSLGLKNQGYLKEGTSPIFSIFNSKSLDQITYNWGRNLNAGE